MDTAGDAYDPLDHASHYARLLTQARASTQVMATVREYLAAWPKARIAKLQRVDGGWAPFDEQQRPVAPYSPADVREIRDAVRSQCASLRGAGIAPARELLELDLFLSLAWAKLAEIDPGVAAPRGGSADRQPRSHAHR